MTILSQGINNFRPVAHTPTLVAAERMRRLQVSGALHQDSQQYPPDLQSAEPSVTSHDGIARSRWVVSGGASAPSKDQQSVASIEDKQWASVSLEERAAGAAPCKNLAANDSQRPSTWWNIFLAIVVCTLFAGGFFVNSAASRLLPEGSAGPPKLLIMMAVGRIIGLASTFIALAYSGGVPGMDASDRMYCSPCSGGVVSVFIQLITLLGFVPYFILSATGDISAIAPLVGVHSMIPVVIGMVFGGERRTFFKVLAAFMSLASVLLLGFAATRGTTSQTNPSASMHFETNSTMADAVGDSEANVEADTSENLVAELEGTQPNMALQIGLLAVVIAIWGTTDQLSSGVAKRIQLYTVIVTNVFGVMMLLCCAFIYVTWIVPSADWGPIGWYHVLYVASNAMAIWAWFIFVYLGKRCEASIFVPIVGSYPTATALLGVAIMGESFTLAKVGGLLLTLASIGLLCWSDSQANKSELPPVAAATAVPGPRFDVAQDQEKKLYEVALSIATLDAPEPADRVLGHFEVEPSLEVSPVRPIDDGASCYSGKACGDTGSVHTVTEVGPTS